MGPPKGTPDSIRAALAAFTANTSWGFSMSAPSTVTTMWISLRNPSGNDGRRRPVDKPGGEGGRIWRPTLTPEERAGNLPRCVHLLLDVDGEREEVDTLPHPPGCRGGDQHSGLPQRSDDGTICLLGQKARLDGDNFVCCAGNRRAHGGGF